MRAAWLTLLEQDFVHGLGGAWWLLCVMGKCRQEAKKQSETTTHERCSIMNNMCAVVTIGEVREAVSNRGQRCAALPNQRIHGHRSTQCQEAHHTPSIE